jgi:hypothetical protein
METAAGDEDKNAFGRSDDRAEKARINHANYLEIYHANKFSVCLNLLNQNIAQSNQTTEVI